ncbi:MAG: CRISPR-associated protein Cas4 [Candidatus Lokiarchaeota archaeon]|nr:CRISPR-associated protein Cas4 [Candidatus Lokiarchaeota archaeon]
MVRRGLWRKRSLKYRSSESTDISEKYLAPTDVKQYVFCPRVTYFTRVMRLKPVMGSQQEAGKKTHKKLTDLEKRRQSVLKSDLNLDIRNKEFEISLKCHELEMHGRLDMLLETKDGEFIPVEFKSMISRKGQLHVDHKYQLVTLSLLLECNLGCIVRRGIIHYIPEELTIQFPISHSIKRRTKFVMKSIQNMILSGNIPDGRRECSMQKVGCGFADYCRDL